MKVKFPPQTLESSCKGGWFKIIHIQRCAGKDKVAYIQTHIEDINTCSKCRWCKRLIQEKKNERDFMLKLFGVMVVLMVGKVWRQKMRKRRRRKIGSSSNVST